MSEWVILIEASTDKGDWVLDPFCGCGTAVIASEKLHRHWVGMDITYLAINLIRNRLKDSFPNIRFKVEGEPQDMSGAVALARESADRYQFQWWAVCLIGARPYGSTDADPHKGKKGADEGIDGWLKFQDGKEGNIETVLVQVKSGGVQAKDIRELRDRLSAKHAAIGIFITLENPTGEMIKEVKATDPYVSPRWKQEYPRIQMFTVEALLKGQRPQLPPTVNLFTEARSQKYARTPPTEDLDKWAEED